MELIIALVLFVGMIAAWIALPGQAEPEPPASGYPAVEESSPAPFPAGTAAA